MVELKERGREKERERDRGMGEGEKESGRLNALVFQSCEGVQTLKI